jgi:hypothetical protein
LHDKRQDIANHEDLRNPSAENERMLFTLQKENDAAQFHVDRGGKQGRSKKEKQALYDVLGVLE